MRHTGWIAIAAAALMASAAAQAESAGRPDVFCSAFLHPLRTVGDTSSDASCSDNDIQSAIDNANPNCTTDIAITREHIWNNQHLTVSGKSINFVGQADGVTCGQVLSCSGFSSCPSSAGTAINAGGSGRALTITGTSYVVLGGLTLTGGNTSGDGGGVAFDGSGALTVYASSIVSNTAANGGGIAFNGSGADVATLALQSEALVISNTANGSGGGVRVSGNAKLVALRPQTLVGFNHAPNGYGGGVQIVAPATADIGSPGYGAGGMIFYNDAAYGGGLALDATADAFVSARLFATDPTKPARISQNFASHTGGGVHLKPVSPSISSYGGGAVLCGLGFRIDGNAAQEGTAIYGDTDSDTFYGSESSSLYLDRVQSDLPGGAGCDTSSIADLGAVPCAVGYGCNEIDANLAQDSNGTPTAGSTILLQNQGSLQSTALDLRGNSGSNALRTFDSAVQLQGCIVADSSFSGPLFKFENQGQINGGAGTEQVHNCTFAGNALGTAVIASAYGLMLHDSLVVQPGYPTLSYSAPAAQLDVAYLLSNDVSTLSSGTGVTQGAPTFVDAAHGDYHQTRDSAGVDYAPPVSGDDRDLDGYPFDQDLPTASNRYGVRDLGAYERQLRYCGAGDTLFCDGFDNI